MAEALTDQLNDAQTHLTEVILTALYVGYTVQRTALIWLCLIHANLSPIQ